MRGARRQIEPRDRGQRRFDACRGSRPECRRRAPGRPASRPATLLSCRGTGTAMTRRAMPEKLRRNPALSLVVSMPTISTSGRGTRSSRSPSAAAIARPPSALWPPSSHSSLSGGVSALSLPWVRRCIRAGHSALAMPASKAASAAPRPAARKRGDGGAGVVDLMAAGKLRQRQIEQPVVVLIDQAAVLAVHAPVLAGDAQRRAQRAAPPARSRPAPHRSAARSPPARRA